MDSNRFQLFVCHVSTWLFKFWPSAGCSTLRLGPLGKSVAHPCLNTIQFQKKIFTMNKAAMKEEISNKGPPNIFTPGWKKFISRLNLGNTLWFQFWATLKCPLKELQPRRFPVGEEKQPVTHSEMVNAKTSVPLVTARPVLTLSSLISHNYSSAISPKQNNFMNTFLKVFHIFFRG